MSDIVLNPLRAGFNLGRINSNFDLLEEVVNNGILHLEGGNNIMKQNLDINSNRILNLPEPLTDSEPVPYGLLVQLLGDSGAALTSPLVQPRQVGDGSNTTFSSPTTKQVAPSFFFVYLDGIKQRPVTDYTIDGSGNVEFVEAPGMGSLVDITFYTPTFKEIDGNETVIATGTTTPRTLADRSSDILHIEDFGAIADVVLAPDGSEALDSGTDNLQAFNIAIQAAGVTDTSFTAKGKVIDLGGKTYGVSGQIWLDSTRNGIKFQNGNVVALPSWSAGAGSAIFRIGTGSSGADQTINVEFERVFTICRKRTSGMLFDGIQKCKASYCKSVGYTEFGFSSKTKTGELILDACSAYEYEYSDTRGHTWANRTGASFLMRTADWYMSNCTGAVSKYGFRYTSGYNVQMTNCHFWVGIVNDKPDSGNVPAFSIDGGRSGMFTNIYIDECIIEIRGKFDHTFIGIIGAQGSTGTTDYLMKLIATEAGETAKNLQVIGARSDRFKENLIRYSTDGGSWGRRKHKVIGLSDPQAQNTEYWHDRVRVSSAGGVVSFTDDVQTEATSLVVNMAPSFVSLGSGYDRVIAAASFRDTNSTDGQMSSFITASAPSGTTGDYNGFHAAGENFGQFWMLTSDGTDFGNATTQYKGGCGLRGVATELHSASALGNKVELYLTENGSTNPTRRFGFDPSAIYPILNSVRTLGKQFLRWATVWTEKVNFGGSNLYDSYGAGSPEGVVTADKGSTYRRSDGGANTSFYVKESGTGNTGWVAK